MPIASIIFSTYNSEEWLRKTLLGFAAQDRSDFEVIVADDGSRAATGDMIESLRQRTPFDIRHVWQPDQGFQKSRILNKAVSASRADYLIFTDGDCIPRRDFVSVHLRLRERGRYLSGGYFKLPLYISNAISAEDIAVGSCFGLEWLRERGLKFKPRDAKLAATGISAALLDWLVPVNATWNGHNSSGWKDDILRANGFDERMGYGGQDREFGERLRNAGIRGKRIRHRAICLHLDHARGYRTQESIDFNLGIREQTRRSRAVRTRYGIDGDAAPLPLSGVVIARNEADRIGRCLDSIKGICSEMLVLDSGSDDGTMEVARAHGARVEHQDWLGFAAQKNAAISRASQPWLLLLDADEWLADGAEADLRALFAGGRVEQADAWRLPRTNWFLGTRLRRVERFERLVRPGHRFLPMKVHERPDLAGKRVRDCGAAIGHDTARSLQQHRDKLKRYARLWAEQKFEEGRRCSALASWTHATAYWFKAYVLDGAWREGHGGRLFHAAHARAVIDKYRSLHALGKAASE